MKKLTWNDIEAACLSLGSRVMASGFKPDYLVGITLGGLVPLMLIAKQLKNRNVFTISANSYEKDKKKELVIKNYPNADLKGKKVLLIDEIADSGETLAKISELLKKEYGIAELKTAVVVLKKTSVFEPDFWELSADNSWVVFPWEKAEA